MQGKIYDRAIKHMLEMKFANQYLNEFYKNSFKIITVKTPELIFDSLKSIDEICKIMDETEKLESIIIPMFKLDNSSEEILNILYDENCDFIMVISLCNYIEQLYKVFQLLITNIIKNILNFSIIPELTDITNDLNKKICDLRFASTSELLNDNNKSYKFTNDDNSY